MKSHGRTFLQDEHIAAMAGQSFELKPPILRLTDSSKKRDRAAQRPSSAPGKPGSEYHKGER